MSGRGLGAQGSHLTSFPETLTFRVFTSQARAHSRPSPTPPKGFLDLPEESPTPRPAPPATTVGTQGQACGGTGCQAQASVTHCVFSWEDRPARQAAQDGGGGQGGEQHLQVFPPLLLFAGLPYYFHLELPIRLPPLLPLLPPLPPPSSSFLPLLSILPPLSTSCDHFQEYLPLSNSHMPRPHSHP